MDAEAAPLIGPAEIETFKAKKLAEGQSKKSINNHLAALRKVLSLAAEWNVIVKVPKVKAFKVKHEFINDEPFLTFDEAERAIVAAALEWRTFVIVALRTGLRVGELLALKWEDVDLFAGQLVVRRTLWHDQEGPPKGGKDRKGPLSDEAIAALKVHRHLKGPFVFCDASGTRLTHSMVKDVVPSACRRAGLAKRLATHGLRHTSASHLVMRGASLKAVQELLRAREHRDDVRYSHLAPNMKRDAVRLLDSPKGISNGNLTQRSRVRAGLKKKAPASPRLTGAKLEREKGFEPSTLALARRCSTTELFPRNSSARGGL